MRRMAKKRGWRYLLTPLLTLMMLAGMATWAGPASARVEQVCNRSFYGGQWGTTCIDVNYVGGYVYSVYGEFKFDADCGVTNTKLNFYSNQGDSFITTVQFLKFGGKIYINQPIYRQMNNAIWSVFPWIEYGASNTWRQMLGTANQQVGSS